MAIEKTTLLSPSCPPGMSLILSWPYLVPVESIVVNTCFLGMPLGKQRPGFDKNGHVYTPRATKEYEKKLSDLFLAELKLAKPDGKSKFALRCRFYRGTRQRIDCDNLMKAVSDAANKVVWTDDSQVMEVIGNLFLADANPRAEILIHRIPDPSPRPKCSVCGKEIFTYPSICAKFCSADCANASKRVTLDCPVCEKSFTVPLYQINRPNRKKRIYCSLSCSTIAARKERDGSKSRTNWKCVDCGSQVSKPAYKRCRACHLSKPSNHTVFNHRKSASG